MGASASLIAEQNPGKQTRCRLCKETQTQHHGLERDGSIIYDTIAMLLFKLSCSFSFKYSMW